MLLILCWALAKKAQAGDGKDAKGEELVEGAKDGTPWKSNVAIWASKRQSIELPPNWIPHLSYNDSCQKEFVLYIGHATL